MRSFYTKTIIPREKTLNRPKPQKNRHSSRSFLTLIWCPWGEKSGNRYNYINSLLYDEFGQRTHIEYGNNTTTDYAYDPLSR